MIKNIPSRFWVIPVLSSMLILLIQFSGRAQENREVLQRLGSSDTIYSEVLEESREIYVELPPSFDTEKKQRFPVVYIIDGEVLLPTVYEVQKYYSGGFTPEMVLIGISNKKQSHQGPDHIKGHHPGMADLMTSKMVEHKNFSSLSKQSSFHSWKKSSPVSNFRSLIGHSYGGLFTLYMLQNHSDLFSNYIAIDPKSRLG